MNPLDGSGLGRLTSVPIREIWPNEATDFTPWLKAHVTELFAALGIDVGEVVSVESEVAVGPFSLDLLIEDQHGRKIAIENQLGATDHSHLGQLLLYGAGLDAKVLIWIASRFREEHRAAITWFNQHTDADVHVFGVRIQTVKIGDSPPAPIFDIVVEPNEWEEAQREATRPSTVNAKRQQFYADVFDRIVVELPSFWIPKAQAENWQSFRSGPFGNYAIVFDSFSRLRVEVYLDRAEPEGASKAMFDRLNQQHREAIEDAVGGTVVWDRLDAARASRLYVDRDAPDFDAPDQVAECVEWAAERTLELMSFDELWRQTASTVVSELG